MNFLIKFFSIFITTIIFNEANGYVLLAANVDDFRHIAKKIISKKVVDQFVETIGKNKNIEADNNKPSNDHLGHEIADIVKDDGPIGKASFDQYTSEDEVTKAIRTGHRYNIQKSVSAKEVSKKPSPENWDDKPFFEDVEIGNENKKGEDHLFYDKFDLTGPKDETPYYGKIAKEKQKFEKQNHNLPSSEEKIGQGTIKNEHNKEMHMQPIASQEQYNDNVDRWKNKDINVYEGGRFKIKNNRKEQRNVENEQEQNHEDREMTTRGHQVQKKERYESHRDKYENENSGITSNVRNDQKDREYSIERTEHYKKKESRQWNHEDMTPKYELQRYKTKERDSHRQGKDSKENKRRPKNNEKESDYRDNKDDHREISYNDERHPKLKHKNRDDEEIPRHKYVDSREEHSRDRHKDNKQKVKNVDSGEQHDNRNDKDRYIGSEEEKNRNRHRYKKQKDKYEGNREEKNRDRHDKNKQNDRYVDSEEEKNRNRYSNNKQKHKYSDIGEVKNRERHGNNKQQARYANNEEVKTDDRHGNNKQKDKYIYSREENRDRYSTNKQKDKNIHKNEDYNYSNEYHSNKQGKINHDAQINNNDNKGRFSMISNEDDDVKRPNQKKSDPRNNERNQRMGTMRPTGVTHFIHASPNYYMKDPNIAEKYDFNEPIPEKDRVHENNKDIIIGDNSMKINGKLKI